MKRLLLLLLFLLFCFTSVFAENKDNAKLVVQLSVTPSNYGKVVLLGSNKTTVLDSKNTLALETKAIVEDGKAKLIGEGTAYLSFTAVGSAMNIKIQILSALTQGSVLDKNRDTIDFSIAIDTTGETWNGGAFSVPTTDSSTSDTTTSLPTIDSAVNKVAIASTHSDTAKKVRTSGTCKLSFASETVIGKTYGSGYSADISVTLETIT